MSGNRESPSRQTRRDAPTHPAGRGGRQGNASRPIILDESVIRVIPLQPTQPTQPARSTNSLGNSSQSQPTTSRHSTPANSRPMPHFPAIRQFSPNQTQPRHTSPENSTQSQPTRAQTQLVLREMTLAVTMLAYQPDNSFRPALFTLTTADLNFSINQLLTAVRETFQDRTSNHTLHIEAVGVQGNAAVWSLENQELNQRLHRFLRQSE